MAKKRLELTLARAAQATDDVRATFFSKVDEFARELHELGLVKYDSFANWPSNRIYSMDELSSDTTKRRNGVIGAAEDDNRLVSITEEGGFVTPCDAS